MKAAGLWIVTALAAADEPASNEARKPDALCTPGDTKCNGRLQEWFDRFENDERRRQQFTQQYEQQQQHGFLSSGGPPPYPYENAGNSNNNNKDASRSSEPSGNSNVHSSDHSSTSDPSFQAATGSSNVPPPWMFNAATGSSNVPPSWMFDAATGSSNIPPWVFTAATGSSNIPPWVFTAATGNSNMPPPTWMFNGMPAPPTFPMMGSMPRYFHSDVECKQMPYFQGNPMMGFGPFGPMHHYGLMGMPPSMGYGMGHGIGPGMGGMGPSFGHQMYSRPSGMAMQSGFDEPSAMKGSPSATPRMLHEGLFERESVFFPSERERERERERFMEPRMEPRMPGFEYGNRGYQGGRYPGEYREGQYREHNHNHHQGGLLDERFRDPLVPGFGPF